MREFNVFFYKIHIFKYKLYTKLYIKYINLYKLNLVINNTTN